MKIKRNGFTLLEILIAIILCTVGVAVVAGLISSGLVGSSDAENTAIAMNLAQRRIEEIRNLTFANIANEAKIAVNGFSGFQREVEVNDPPGDPTTADLKQVTVTVYWTFKGGGASISLMTFMSGN